MIESEPLFLAQRFIPIFTVRSFPPFNRCNPLMFPNSTIRRGGFTLVELLVVIAIIGILMGMAVPAMQNMRELSRRSNCQQNLTQLSLAISNYSNRYGHYPIGTVADMGPIRSEAKGFHHNWISGLLPMLDAENVSSAVDRTVSVYAKSNDAVRQLQIPVLRCPSATDVRDNTTCYAGMTSSAETPIDETNDGVFILNRPIHDADISDGLGYTLFVGEKISDFEDDLGWISGTRSSLRNAGHRINDELVRIRGVQTAKTQVGPLYVGGLASDHPGGAYVLFGSGEHEFLSKSTDAILLSQMTSRADGSIPAGWQTDEPLGPTPSSPTPAASQQGAEASAAADSDEN